MSVSFDPAIWLNPHTSTISRITRVINVLLFSRFFFRISILNHHFHQTCFFLGDVSYHVPRFVVSQSTGLRIFHFKPLFVTLTQTQRIHQFFRGFVRFQVGETWRFRDRLEFRNSKITQNPKVKLLTLMTWKCQISTLKGKKNTNISAQIAYYIYIYISAQLTNNCFFFVFHKSHHPFIPPVHLQVDSSNPLAPQSDQPFRIGDLREEIPYEMQKVTYGIYMSCTIYLHVISIHVMYILIPYTIYRLCHILYHK